MLREKKGWYELVITDLHMPEMDGIELLQQIKLEMDLPVIRNINSTLFSTHLDFGTAFFWIYVVAYRVEISVVR